MNIIYFSNLIAVGIFGMVLSSSFCEIVWTRKKILVMVGGIAGLFMLQGIIYFFIDSELVEYIYPLITHLPLSLLLYILSGKYLWSLVSVLTAYFCCQIRRWLALLVVAVFSGGAMMQDATELVLTLPILFALVHYISPAVRSVSHYPFLVQCQFGVIPALYYGFDYLTRVYTDWLLNGVSVAVEFMSFLCCLAYATFVVYTSYEERTRSRLKQTQEILNIQIGQAVREIKSLRELQQKTGTYRHDLRHHMQYISSCIENERYEQAQAYIQEICSEIEAGSVTAFCENEAANLIFSAFEGRAEESGIPINIRAVVPQNIHISESDLCVLISNAMENALNECVKLKKEGLTGTIDVSAYEKNGKLFLQIINTCNDDIVFESGIPVTDNPGHGFGVRSICTIVEKYGGIYTFLTENGRFILRISL